MRRLLFCIGLLLAGTVQADGEIRDLAWGELVPAETVAAPEMAVQHEGGEEGPAAAQPLPDAPVVRALDGARVRLPGYIVPLETRRDGLVTEFLLVPYFGACIHVPPPPANQIVHVRTAAGVVQEALYQPYWVEGTLKVEQSRSDIAVSGYTLQPERIFLYELPASGAEE